MLDLPTYAWPFILAVIAAVAGVVLGGSPREEPGSLPRVMLWAVAAGCVVVGLATWWLGRAS